MPLSKDETNSKMRRMFSRLHLVVSSLMSGVYHGFRSLNGSPNELWKAYTLKFLDSYSYFSFSVVFTLFLSSDFAYTDVEAGTIYGAWGALITVYGLFAGCVVDNLGVANSLRVGFLISLVSRCVIFVTTSRFILLLNVCVLLPIGNCLGIPVLTTGIRRYTNEQNRGFAFGLFYVIMNVAALLSGPVVDACTILYKNNGTDNTRTGASSADIGTGTTEWSLTGYRMVVLTGVVANVIAVFVTLTIREIKVQTKIHGHHSEYNTKTDGMEMEDIEKKPISNSSTSTTCLMVAAPQPTTKSIHINANESYNNNQQQKVATFTPLQGSAWSILKETMNTNSFWRFLAVCLITLNVRMIFRHLDATLPKYMIREFGQDVPKGTIYSINPALIIILVPLVTAKTSKTDPLIMIFYGTYISAASVFFLAVSTTIWSSVSFVIVLSIGEAIWSPRLYDYTMSVTKEGREGTYMALSSAPLFLAKLPVGYMSGRLLERYCPVEGPRNSKKMWLIIALTTVSSPVLLTIFWSYISKKYDDDDDDDNSNLAKSSYKKDNNNKIHYTELQQQHFLDKNDNNVKCQSDVHESK